MNKKRQIRRNYFLSSKISIELRDYLIKYIIPILVFLSLAIQVLGQSILLDEFNTNDGWKIYKSDGVDIKITSVDGYKGKCIRIDYNFTKGSGYGGIQKEILIEYPNNYQFTFYLKAKSPNNNLEFKLIDASGENVWWMNNRNYEFPTEWKKISIKKRHLNFAWGPTEDKSLRKTDKLEFTIASYTGGKGTLYIDELSYEPLTEISSIFAEPLITANSTSNKSDIKYLTDINQSTIWHSEPLEKQQIIFDFQGRKEFGGIKILWDEKDYAKKINVLVSNDGIKWESVYKVENCNGGVSYIRLNEYEASFVKIEFLRSSHKKGYALKEVEIKNVDWSADINQYFMKIAKESPRGYYPRYLNEEASYWNIIGVNGDEKEAMINEEGMVEADKLNFSLEPFLYYDGKLKTWNDVKTIQGLENNYLPIPFVKWLDDVQLETKAFASGEANKSSILYLSYRLKNVTNVVKKGKYFLALRPFQVNPYYQWLNITGGAAKLNSIKYSKNRVIVNDNKVIVPLTKPDDFGAAFFDEGNIISFLSNGKVPMNKSVTDQTGCASGAFEYPFNLKPGEEKIFYFAVPFYSNKSSEDVLLSSKQFEQKFTETKKYWEDKTSYMKYKLPASAQKILNIIRSNLSYILINRDKSGIQPGSRSYERSWIRDGSLTSSALLKNGIVNEVKEFIEWYTANQFENGKVPCVVDRRGPDPVPENDSHGEFIYLIKEYFNFTHDTTFLKSKYENVKRAVNYIESLVEERLTNYYKNGNDSLQAYYGIMPESISHEGYSDKPRHSYWDNFWTMKGLKDAVEISKIVGTNDEVIRMTKLRDEFKENLYNSIRLATQTHNIDYIPGCVELGDYDATSTTIALSPCNEINNLPPQLLKNTFDRYFNFTENRAEPTTDWSNYTPYEVRTIGSFIFLDQPEKAHQLIDYFVTDQRPKGWNHWAEVVWKDKRKPAFIGDMPHTWVGSDFVNAIRAMFVYENESDSSLVIGAGLYQDWIDSPETIKIENLPTYYGSLSYAIGKTDNYYVVNIFGNIDVPKGGIVLKNFNSSRIPLKIYLNGEELIGYSNNKIVIKVFPATLMIIY